MERGRPLDGVYFLRTNGQRPWSYASYDTCNPPCDEGFTCDDGQCLCGSYNGTVCSGQTPSCLTSSNYTVGYDLSSRCRACVKQRFTISTKLVQGSCPSSDYVCLDDGSCRFGSSDDENIVSDYQEDDTYNYDNNSDYVSNNIETMYDDTLGNDDYESDPVNNIIETMYDDSLGTKQ